MHHRLILCLFIAAALSATVGASPLLAADDSIEQRFRQEAAPLIERYCGECHGPTLAEAELNLVDQRDQSTRRQSLRQWILVRRMLGSRQMPPPSAPQPTEAERRRLERWVRDMLAVEARATAGDPGPVALRRLSNDEYNYAIQDLTGVSTLRPTAQFPVDGAAGEGFINVGDGQGMSPALIQKYLDAGKQVASHLVLLPDTIRFSPYTTRRDETDRLIREIQEIYFAHSLDSNRWEYLHGIKLRANEDGLLPLRRYVEVLVQHRDMAPEQRRPLAEAAAQRKLSPRYLKRLWSELTATPETNSDDWILQSVRERFQAGDSAATLAAFVERIQQAVWKFNTVGQIGRAGGPSRWQEPVTPIAQRQSFSLPLGNVNEGDVEVTIRLAASVLASDANPTVVWESPRLEFPSDTAGRRPPPLMLRDVAEFTSRFESFRQSELARTEVYLETLAAATQANGESKSDNDLNPQLLESWRSLLDLQSAQPPKIQGHFRSRVQNVQNYASVNGWGKEGTPSLLTNRAEQPVSFLTLTVPARGVTVHPSPSEQVVIAWRCPEAGKFDVEGQVADADAVCGNGAAWRLEQLTGQGRVTLLARSFDNGGRSDWRLPKPVQLSVGDVLQLVVDARDRNHVCDTTSVRWKITGQVEPSAKAEAANRPRTWDLAEQVVDRVLEANPLSDRYGNAKVWHFCIRESGKQKTTNGIPPGSVLARWRAALVSGDTKANQRALAEQVKQTLLRPAKTAADQRLRETLLDWKGPLHWSDAVRSEKATSVRSTMPVRYGVASERFGKAPRGTKKLNPNSLAVSASEPIQFRLPRWLIKEATFVVDGRLLSGNEGSAAAQLQVAATELSSPLDPSQPVVLSDGAGELNDRLRSAYDRFRQLFPRAVCYRRLVPVDEVVTLTLFHREDEPLRRLLLSPAEIERLDRLWDELLFVSQEPLKKVVVLEQIREFATQDRPDLVKALAPMQAEVDARAKRFQLLQAAAEPKHLQAILQFASQAWRRDLAPQEESDLRGLYQAIRESGLDHEASLRLLVVRVLNSPAFLYKLETPATGNGPQPVNDWELASRLSFFLWSSIPDARLLALARQGELSQPDVLREQIRRMLDDPRAERLAVQFACQWLHLRNFDQNADKNLKRFPQFERLRKPMYDETVKFFAAMVRDNGSILDLIEADYVDVNGPLAEHYGIPWPEGVERDQWIRVPQARRYGRGGLLGMGSVLASQSGASRTSPILRGNWIYETLLGERLPRPPADVPTLPEAPPAGLSTRELIERHSRDPACAKCHAHIDPMGFALEQYDAIGRLRDIKADTNAKLPDGTSLTGTDDLRNYLARSRQGDIVRQFSRKLLGFATGREVMLSDEPLLEALEQKLERDRYRFRAAVEEIVFSPQFRNIRAK